MRLVAAVVAVGVWCSSCCATGTWFEETISDGAVAATPTGALVVWTREVGPHGALVAADPIAIAGHPACSFALRL